MQATITPDGKLIVTPNNSVEAYALSKWQEDYSRRKPKASLQIDARMPEYLVLELEGLL